MSSQIILPSLIRSKKEKKNMLSLAKFRRSEAVNSSANPLKTLQLLTETGKKKGTHWHLYNDLHFI